MFEGFFRKKKVDIEKIKGKEAGEPSIDGVAHFDATRNDPKFYPDRHAETAPNELEGTTFDERKFSSEVQLRDEFKDFRASQKISNERRKEKLGDRNSGIKGKDLFEAPRTAEEVGDEILAALEDQSDKGGNHKEAA